jgi:hypothetical protein
MYKEILSIAAAVAALAGNAEAAKKNPYQRSNTYRADGAAKPKARASGPHIRNNSGGYGNYGGSRSNVYAAPAFPVDTAASAISKKKNLPPCQLHTALKKVAGDNGGGAYYGEGPGGNYTEQCAPPEYHAGISSKDADGLRETVKNRIKTVCDTDTVVLIGYSVAAVKNFKAGETLAVLFCGGRPEEDGYRNCINEVCGKYKPRGG